MLRNNLMDRVIAPLEDKGTDTVVLDK